MTSNRCPICSKMLINSAKICETCSRQTRVRLAEIPPMYIEAGAYLEPGRGGFGSSGSERTIGVSLAALGFRQAGEILPILEDYERVVRVDALGQTEFDGVDREGELEEDGYGNIIAVVRPRDDPSARPIMRTGTIQERVEGVCMFLLAHAQWLSCYEDAVGFYEAVAKIHSQGLVATRKYIEKTTKIKCPTGLEELDEFGEIHIKRCGMELTLLKDNILKTIECKRCKTEWSTVRLVDRAVKTPGETIWFDSYEIAGFLGVTADYVTKLARKHKAKKRGARGEETYDLTEIQALRDAVRRTSKAS